MFSFFSFMLRHFISSRKSWLKLVGFNIFMTSNLGGLIYLQHLFFVEEKPYLKMSSFHLFKSKLERLYRVKFVNGCDFV